MTPDQFEQLIVVLRGIRGELFSISLMLLMIAAWVGITATRPK